MRTIWAPSGGGSGNTPRLTSSRDKPSDQMSLATEYSDPCRRMKGNFPTYNSGGYKHFCKYTCSRSGDM